MTADVASGLARLTRERPEWRPWLAVVGEAVRELEAAAWDAAVPECDPPRPDAEPLLAGATVVVETRAVRRLLERLLHVASRSGTSEMATLRSVSTSGHDVIAWFKASLCHRREIIEQAAAAAGVDADALHAVVSLLSAPFLHACNRRWAATMSPAWLEGYCPVCGTWPAFAEARGIERRRYFRCGRCSSEWHARPLRCPHCGIDDHHALVTLVPDDTGTSAVIEGCRSCLCYVKTFTRLQGSAPGMVMVDDLATVHLDVAALQHGYIRPPHAGHSFDVCVSGTNAAHRFFARIV